MNEKNDFALVRKPSSAVEKSALGAKRILSGMVADTLALVKKEQRPKRVFRVLTCCGDKDISKFLQSLIETLLESDYDVEVTDRWKVTEILELVKQQSFDIIIPVVNNIYRPTHVDEDRILKTVELLTNLKAQYGMPIIALSGFKPSFDLPELLKRRGVDAFFWMPFDNGEFLSAVQRCLKLPLLNRPDAETPPVVADTELENWFQTGEKYYFGEGVAKDAMEAANWYRKAAEQNHVKAQYALGDCYYKGEGVTKNEMEAVNWYRKAAEQNHVPSQHNLGFCYGNGQGVTHDDAEAVKWYRKAAEQNFAIAQHNLGFCYEKGHGVQQDFPEAYKLYKLAADQNQEKAVRNLKRIMTRMTAVEIAEGERRVREFRSQKI